MRYNSAFTFQQTIDYVNVPPYIYRYEDQKYIDDFFETGRLRIGCFSVYKAYIDNHLGDPNEGRSFVMEDDGERISGAGVQIGMNAHCFCCSTLLSKELLPIFSRNGVFQITDPINFMHEVACAMPWSNLDSVFFGNCTYVNQRIYQYKAETPIDPLNPKLPNISPVQLFLKDMKYQQQSEYRMIWMLKTQVLSHIDITVPAARIHCEKIEVDKLN